jgi:hypothetical protein
MTALEIPEGQDSSPPEQSDSAVIVESSNDVHSANFQTMLDEAFRAKGPEANRISSEERRAIQRELQRKQRFGMHNMGSMRRGRPPKE